MRLRRILLFLMLATAVAVVIRRLRGQNRQARIDVYLADGSLTSLADDVPEGSLLLSLAREVRSA
jgi:hypothetical protein